MSCVSGLGSHGDRCGGRNAIFPKASSPARKAPLLPQRLTPTPSSVPATPTLAPSRLESAFSSLPLDDSSPVFCPCASMTACFPSHSWVRGQPMLQRSRSTGRRLILKTADPQGLMDQLALRHCSPPYTSPGSKTCWSQQETKFCPTLGKQPLLATASIKGRWGLTR